MTTCSFSDPSNVNHPQASQRATEAYGEPVCDRCARLSHKPWDECSHNDDTCPWRWFTDAEQATLDSYVHATEPCDDCGRYPATRRLKTARPDAYLCGDCAVALYPVK